MPFGLALDIGLGVTSLRGVSNPHNIFGSSLKVWFDVQDLSTMWQDASATVPAAVGSRVYKQFCKANPAFYREQATEASRPYLRQAANGAYCLECQGTDDGMVTPSIDLSATDKIAVFTAARKLSDAATAAIVEHGTPGVDARSWNMSFPRTNTLTGAAIQFRDGTNTPEVRAPNAAAPVTQVLTALADYAPATVAEQAILRTNGSVTGNTTAGTVATGTFGNYPISFFRRSFGGTVPFNGYEYGNMIVSGTPTAAQIAWAENYYNQLASAY